MVILDTNLIIDHLRTGSEESMLMKLSGEFGVKNLALSIVSVQELYAGKSTRKELKEQYLLTVMSPLAKLPYDYLVSELAGEIIRDSEERIITFADAAIAATALIHKSKLATLNKRDFEEIPGVELLNFDSLDS
jgi:predicted nucleic acid-binding protein